MMGLGGPYKLQVQLGPDRADNMEFEFETVTAGTTGLSGVAHASVSSAQTSIETAQSGRDLIADERAATGEMINRVNHIIDDLTADYINTRGSCSTIKDADMAEHASRMAKQQVILNSSQAFTAQANTVPAVVLDFIAESGIGQDGNLTI